MLTVLCPHDARDCEKQALPDKTKQNKKNDKKKQNKTKRITGFAEIQMVEKHIALNINRTPAVAETSLGKPHRSL